MNAPANSQGFNLAEKPMDDEQEEFFSKVMGVVDRLSSLAKEQVAKKAGIEDRWYKDLRQYYGMYDEDTQSRLKKQKGKSALFMNYTRPKVEGWRARQTDILYPNDGKNWGIGPTPVPEIREAMRNKADEEQRQAAINFSDEASERAELMEAEMDDQLTECGYNAACRDALDDLPLYGVAVMKGPMVNDRVRRRWRSWADEAAGETNPSWKPEEKDDPSPKYMRIDPWSWFPDMDAARIDECEFFFERHVFTRKQLRKLAKLTGWNVAAIRQMLTDGPKDAMPDYLSQLKGLAGGTSDQGVSGKRFVVWEYRGPLTAEDLSMLAIAFEDDQMAAELGEIDPLDEMQAVVYFTDTQVLYFGEHHLSDDAPVYSCTSFIKDEGSLFGFGVPTLLRNSQTAYNAAWRMMMNNSGLAAGPQVVVNRDVVQPASGNSYAVEPGKTWVRKIGAPPNIPAFETYDFNSHQGELANLVALISSIAEEEAAMPRMVQDGGDGEKTMPQQTATGMNILMNAANVILRKVIRNIDDDITIPNIQRLFEWNMLYNERDEIKGDFEAKALGSTQLLTRDIETQNIIAVLDRYSLHPIYGKRFREDAVELIGRAQGLPADKLFKTADEIQRDEEKASQQGGEPPIEMIQMQHEMNVLQAKHQHELQVEQMKQQTETMKIAQHYELSLAELDSRLRGIEIKASSDERKQAAEIAVKDRWGEGL